MTLRYTYYGASFSCIVGKVKISNCADEEYETVKIRRWLAAFLASVVALAAIIPPMTALAQGSATVIELPLVDPLSVTGDIIAAGSSTVAPLSERMAEGFRYYGYSGNLTIDVVGTGAGFERFCVAGETDISIASRAIKNSEREACRAIGREPIAFRVGSDGLTVVVSQANDFLADVTLAELTLLFSTAEKWSDVRAEWPAEAIQRFVPGTDSGTFDYFVEAVFDGNAEPLLVAKNVQFSEDDNVLVQGIVASPYAIGFFGYAYYEENVSALKMVALDGVTPTMATVEGGSYALSRPLFIYSTANIMSQKPQVAAFINYYLTYVNEQAADLGYFPASVEILNQDRADWLVAVGEPRILALRVSS